MFVIEIFYKNFLIIRHLIEMGTKGSSSEVKIRKIISSLFPLTLDDK